MATIAALKPADVVSALDGYDPDRYFCELLGREHQPSRSLTQLWHRLGTARLDELRERAKSAEAELFKLGITFTVYTDKDAIDRILPFDVVPRVLTADVWRKVEAGVKQRVRALNLFLDDVYHGRRILRDGVIPSELVLGNPNYQPAMRDVNLPCGTYVHINGTDIVRDGSGELLVLEDNARTPSGLTSTIRTTNSSSTPGAPSRLLRLRHRLPAHRRHGRPSCNSPAPAAAA